MARQRQRRAELGRAPGIGEHQHAVALADAAFPPDRILVADVDEVPAGCLADGKPGRGTIPATGSVDELDPPVAAERRHEPSRKVGGIHPGVAGNQRKAGQALVLRRAGVAPSQRHLREAKHDLRVAAGQFLEAASGQVQQLAVAQGHHPRVAGLAGEQPGLADGLPRSDGAELAQAAVRLPPARAEAPVDQQIHAVGVLALLEQQASPTQGEPLDLVGQGFQRGRRHVREQRLLGQGFEHLATDPLAEAAHALIPPDGVRSSVALGVASVASLVPLHGP
ncbi:MAG: hypothetical protein KatS3mg126_1830 [Lysobacteraceae bacterium]|nr:MAG: hypothetical protein KatS3mg126_1830 [Xanthomonadaceae bacterium]